MKVNITARDIAFSAAASVNGRVLGIVHPSNPENRPQAQTSAFPSGFLDLDTISVFPRHLILVALAIARCMARGHATVAPSRQWCG